MKFSAVFGRGVNGWSVRMSSSDGDSTFNVTIRKKHTHFNDEKIETAMNLVRSGANAKMIASATGVSIRSAQSFIAKTYPETPGGPFRRFTMAMPGRKPANDEELRQHVDRLYDEDQTLTQKMVIDRLPAHLKCSVKKLGKLLKRCNYTRKRIQLSPHERNSPANLRARRLYASEMARYSNDQLIFIDETGFNLHTGPIYGWAKRGLTPTDPRPANRRGNISMVMAIALNRVIGFEVKLGAYNGSTFLNFIGNVVQPHLRADDIMVLDNCSIHRDGDVIDHVRQDNLRMKFLPPYSPQLNPIEEVFAMVKARYRRIRPAPSTQEEVIERITQVVDGLMNYDFINFYLHMRATMDKCFSLTPL